MLSTFLAIDDPITVTLQQLRAGFPQLSCDQGRGNCVGPDVEPNNSSIPAADSELGDGEEVARERRQPAEPAQRFLLQLLQLVVAPTPRSPNIDFEPHRFRLNVARRQQLRNRQVQVRNPELGHFGSIALQRQFQKMAVQGWAEHLHVAGLLLGEQIPSATKIQVARADRKSRTGPAQLLENREPLFGAVGACFGEEMRERAGAATAHPPPQLMKLRQSEFL